MMFFPEVLKQDNFRVVLSFLGNSYQVNYVRILRRVPCLTLPKDFFEEVGEGNSWRTSRSHFLWLASSTQLEVTLYI